MNYNNIALCGFMGAGKTTVAKELSVLMGMKYVDMDDLIEKSFNLSIPEIFSYFGEKEFRKAEFNIANDICTLKNVVISTGGGTFSNNEIATMFIQHDIAIIYLKSPFDVLYERIRLSEDRPIVKQKNKSELKDLYDARCKIYENISTFTQNAVDSPTNICKEIKNRLLN